MWMGVQRVSHRAKPVSEQNLLPKPKKKPGDADRKIVTLDPAAPIVGKLRHHFAVVDDGSGDQMRKEGNEQHIGEQVLPWSHSLREVDKICDLGEREERDPQGQNHSREVPPHPAYVMEVLKYGK